VRHGPGQWFLAFASNDNNSLLYVAAGRMPRISEKIYETAFKRQNNASALFLYQQIQGYVYASGANTFVTWKLRVYAIKC